MLQFLHQLRPRGLARSSRLKRDLEFLTGLHPTDLSVLLAQYPGDKAADFCAHIRKAVKQKPHVLVAYAWCFYMAVFSGGRWIRQQLMNADEDFWRTSTSNQEAEQVPLKEKGLSFWNFDGDNDGEDIKALFKSRLSAAEDLLTPSERIDIIEEAKSIFTFSASLVEELDEKLGTNMEKIDLHQRLEKKRAAEQPQKDHADGVSVKVSRQSVMWLRRPEVTGMVVAVGCLVFVALTKFDPRGGW
jgi:heme oxygenase